MATLTDTVTLQTFTLTAGATYTALVSVFRNADSPTVKLLVNGTSSNEATATGWTELRVTYTALASTPVQLVPTSNAGGKLYVDNFLNITGTYAGDYFDGSLFPNGEFAQLWTGTAHDSTSTQTGVPVVTASASATGVSYQTSTSPGDGRAVTAYATASGAMALRVSVTTLQANRSYAVNGKLLSPKSGSWTIQIRPDIATTTDAVTLGTVTLTANTPQTFSFVGTSSASGTWGANSGIAVVSTGSLVPGDSITLDELLVEQSTIVREYFDGNTPSTDDDLDSGWTGAIDGSSSIVRGVTVSGFGTANNAALVSATSQRYQGSRSGKVFYAATASSGNNGLSLTKSLAANTTYTVSAYVYVPAGSVHPRFSIQSPGYTTVNGTASSTFDSWVRISATFTTTLAANYSIYIVNSAATTSGQFFFVDSFLLESSPTVNDYFDGNTPSVSGDYPTVWSGTEADSVSYQQGAEPATYGEILVNAKIVQSRTESYSGNSSMQVFATALDGRAVSSLYPSLTSDALYFASVWVKGEVGKSLAIRLYEYDATDVEIAVTDGTTTAMTGSWQRLSVSKTLSSTSVKARIAVLNKTAGAHTFFVDAELLEQTSILRDYFDGSLTSPDSDIAFNWTSEVHASRSAAVVADVSGVVSNNVAEIQSSQWAASGAKSLRIYGTSSSTDSYVTLRDLTPSNAGKSYTVMAKVRLSAPLVSPGASSRSFVITGNGAGWVNVIGTSAPNTAGVHTIMARFTTPADFASGNVRIYLSAAAGNGEMWIDDFLMVEGFYEGEYFDGSTPSVGGRLNEWVGTANASTSTSTTTTAYAKNLILNPSLERVATGTNTLRTNLLSNPNMELTAWDDYSTGAGITQSTVEFFLGESSTRIAPSLSGMRGAKLAGTSVLPGAKYTFSVWVLREAGSSSMAVSIEWFAGASLLSAEYSISSLPPIGQWTRFSVTSTAPLLAETASVNVLFNDAVSAIDVAYIDAALFEQTDQLRDYFDGSYTDNYGWAYSWSGLADESSSVAKALASTIRSNFVINPNFEVDTTGWAVNNAAVIARSTEQKYLGSASLKVDRTGSTDDFAVTTVSGLVPGSTYTASAYIYLTGVGSTSNSRGFTAWGNTGGSFSDTPYDTSKINQWQRLSVQVVAGTAGTIQVRIHPTTDFSVYADSVMLEDSSTVGDYFDGSFGTSSDALANAWSGAANASISLQRGAALPTYSSAASAAYQSRLWSSTGQHSIAVRRTRTGDAYAAGALSAFGAANKTYTVSVTARTVGGVVVSTVGNSFVQESGGGFRALGIIIPNGTAITATPTRYTATFTCPIDVVPNLRLILRTGSAVGSVIYYDDISVVEGAYVGPYFSGETDPDVDVSVDWDGTPHDSVSTLFADPVTDYISNFNGVSVFQSELQAYSGGSSAKVLFNGTSSGQTVTLLTPKPVSPFLGYTASIWVKGDAGKVVRIDMHELTSTSGLVGTTSSSNYTLSGSWERISVTRVMGSTAALAEISVVNVNAVTNTVYLDSALLEKTLSVNDYFDGSLGDAGDFRFAWTGLANQSTSIEAGVGVSEIGSGDQIVAVQSLEWSEDRGRSVRLIPTGPANATNVERGVPIASTSIVANTVTLQRNKTYTIVGRMRLEAPLTGTLDSSRSRRIWYSNDGGNSFISGSTQSPNVAGEYAHSLVIQTTSAGENVVYLGHGGEYGSGDVWWDQVMVIEGVYSGPYFDGSLPDTDDTTYIWNGATDASTSAITVSPLLNWTGVNGAIVYRDSVNIYAGSRSGLVTCTGVVGLQGVKLIDRATVTPSTTYFASAWVKGEAGKLIRIELQEWSANGTYINSSTGPSITATGEWQRVSVSRTLSSSGARADVVISNVQATPHTFYVDSVLLEASATLQNYFDGNFPAEGDFSYSWNGTPEAATSQYQGASIKGSVSTEAFAVQSSVWSGAGIRSMRIISIAGGASSAYVELGGTVATGLEPGKTYTVMAKVYREQTASQIGNLVYQGFVGGILTQNINAEIPASIGIHDVSITFTVALDIESASLKIYNNQPKGSPDMWVDQFFVVEGEYTGDYFDGDSDSTVGAFPILYQWSGAEHDSTSVRDVGGAVPTGGAEILQPFGEAERTNSTATLEIKYRSGWLG